MLKYFFENDLIRFDDVSTNWEDAVSSSCQNLIEKKLITDQYVSEVINCVKEFGPYIVIVPGVAMPHSTQDSSGVLGTAISFTKMKNNISFEEGNDEKDAKLFFTLAAKNPDEHVENIAKLSDLLMTDGLIEDLMDVNTIEDYQLIMNKY